MNNYINPVVELLPNPVGLDYAIQEIQIKFASNLAWLQKSFGRCFIQKEVVPPSEAAERMGALYGNFTREVIYPEVYTKNGEPINLMPNDNLKAYSFFKVNDPIRIKDYEPFEKNRTHVAPVSIIFWMNLQKIDPLRKYRFTEELKIDILNVIAGVPGLAVEQTFEGFNRVFDGFILTDTYSQYTKPPYSALRIDCELTYNDNGCQ